MSLKHINKIFPEQNDAIKFIEQILWEDCAICPYCSAKHSSKRNITKKFNVNRYHCNNCNTDFTVLVNTLFQNTKISIQKWILAIYVFYKSENIISARVLATKIEVTKDTASRIIKQIKNNLDAKDKLVMAILKLNLNKEDL